MKVFISWSGDRSRAVAEMINDWLQCVIQAVQPWISTRNIDRGAIWFSEIGDKLRDVSIGIVCLTKENKDRPWILFEAGALAKGLTTNRVCTFLIDLEPADLKDPLAQFNHTVPEKESVWELVRTINDCLDEKKLDERILMTVFETYWDKFLEDFETAVKENEEGEEVPDRSEADILSEILTNTRVMSRRIRRLEVERKSKDTIGDLFLADYDEKTNFSKKSAEFEKSSLTESFSNEELVDALKKFMKNTKAEND